MQLAASARVVSITALALLANGGKLRVFTTDAADPDIAPAATLLAELDFAPVAFQAATDDTATASISANPLAKVNISATGQAGSWRAYKADGTLLTKGTVSLVGGSGELQVSKLDLLAGGTFEVTSLSWRAGQG